MGASARQAAPGQGSAAEENEAMTTPPRQTFWRRTRGLTALLLLTWMSVNIVLPWCARDLDAVHGFGFPAGYWLVAEGALLIYLLIVFVYAWAMDRLEQRCLEDSAVDGSGPGPA
jgi:putative solute:sodium symporter small subunit